jgi:glutaredoxin
MWRTKKRVTFDSEFVVYGTMSCGYTVKMCEHLQKTERTFEFVDVRKNTDRYMKELARFGVKSSGVPFVVHKPSDTYFIGFKPV